MKVERILNDSNFTPSAAEQILKGLKKTASKDAIDPELDGRDSRREEQKKSDPHEHAVSQKDEAVKPGSKPRALSLGNINIVV